MVKEVIQQLINRGYSHETAVELIAKHSDVYEVNELDGDYTPSDIAESLIEASDQEDDDDDE